MVIFHSYMLVYQRVHPMISRWFVHVDGWDLLVLYIYISWKLTDYGEFS